MSATPESKPKPNPEIVVPYKAKSKPKLDPKLVALSKPKPVARYKPKPEVEPDPLLAKPSLNLPPPPHSKCGVLAAVVIALLVDDAPREVVRSADATAIYPVEHGVSGLLDLSLPVATRVLGDADSAK